MRLATRSTPTLVPSSTVARFRDSARARNSGTDPRGPPEKLDLFKVFWKQLRIQGSTMGSPDDFSAMLKWVAKHGIRPVIDDVVPLEDGPAAVERMKSSPQFGKYVLSQG